MSSLKNPHTLTFELDSCEQIYSISRNGFDVIAGGILNDLYHREKNLSKIGKLSTKIQDPLDLTKLELIHTMSLEGRREKKKALNIFDNKHFGLCKNNVFNFPGPKQNSRWGVLAKAGDSGYYSLLV